MIGTKAITLLPESEGATAGAALAAGARLPGEGGARIEAASPEEGRNIVLGPLLYALTLSECPRANNVGDSVSENEICR